jgi:glycosyltransferase involved in cell wall biosynthesis
MKISFIVPSRNNLKYLKWMYDSVRKNQGNHDVQICVADDASTDGTWEWCMDLMDHDHNFIAIKNQGPDRLGLVILNDRLINEVAKYDICMVFHADMYLMPGAIDQIEHKLKENTIVSLTRIEPSLHPPGPEKMLFDCGMEPEEFEEQKLLDWFKDIQLNQLTKCTEGIFAPWAFYKKDFQEIGGHDLLFAPQSKEDSDIFNRFQLNGIKFIQTWGGCVYHMTCRGSRFNTFSGGAPGKDSDEWLKQNQKATREFIRKWGHFCLHDKFLKPIIPPKYDIGFVITNANLQLIEILEPWCSTVYYDENEMRNFKYADYIEKEDTSFDLYEKFKPYDNEKQNGILIEIDGSRFSQDDLNYIQNISAIINDSGEIGEFQLGNIKVTINNLITTEKELIICKK